MATLVPDKLGTDGIVTFAAASVGGDDFPAVPGNILYFINNDAAFTRSITIAAVVPTVNTPEAGELSVPDMVILVPFGGGVRIAHVPPAYVANNLVTMTYNDEADLLVGVAYIG